MDNVIDIEDYKFSKRSSDVIWRCSCGSDAFYLYADCYVCQECEKEHSFEDVHGSI